MAEYFHKPAPLSFEGNCAENWRIFEQEYDIFIAAAYHNAPKKTRAFMLLNLAGSEAIERERSFTYKPAVITDGGEIVTPGETREDPAVLKQKFKEICDPRTNVTIERHAFNSRTQRSGESIQAYVADLRNKASTCQFGELKEGMIRDRLVCGIQKDNVRKLLLREADLTLPKALSICQIHEISEQHNDQLSNKPKVDAVNTNQGQARHRGQRGRQGQNRQNPHQQSNKPATQGSRMSKPQRQPNSAGPQRCNNCGGTHPLPREDHCPAFGKQCRACLKWNHFDKCCMSNPQSAPRPRRQYGKHVHGVDDDDDDYGGTFVIESVDTTDIHYKNEIHCTLRIHGTDIDMKVDTGAKCNVIPYSLYTQLNRGERIDTHKVVNLIAYGGTRIHTRGEVRLPCRRKGKVHMLPFFVVDYPVTALIGLRDSLNLGLITLHDVHSVDATPAQQPVQHPGTPDFIAEYSDLFTGDLGTLPVQYKMRLNPDVTPVVHPPRRIPIAVQDQVKDELNRMVAKQVITPVTEPTEWVSSMVATIKKNKKDVCICIDPRDLNKAILRPHYPSRTIEEVTSRMPGAKIFSVLDASTGFWQIPLDHESSLATTFNTPYGRYRFLRMPFGITSASEVFQKTMDHLFDGCPCEIIVDDILVWGKDEAEHDDNLRQVLDRAREVNLQLGAEKCKFRVPEVPYVGHLLTPEGLKPDPAKVKAVREMPKPDSVPALQRYLGFINYLAKFMDHLTDLTEPLRELVHKDTAWYWTDKHTKAFDDIRDAVSSPPLLKYYDVKKPVTLTCDASKSGLGAACLQDGMPIAYASRALTDTQCKYAQIEKEMLAVVFACQKFHDFIFGREATVETDHQPLVSIHKKPLHCAPMRLQKMLLQLQPYNLQLIYKQGSKMHIADALSRAYLPDAEDTSSDSSDYHIMIVTLLTPSKMTELQNAIAQDASMQRLMSYIKNGWPHTVKVVPPELTKFYDFHDELTIASDVVLRGDRLVVPPALQAEYTQQLHKGHLGVDACKRRAQDTLYWPTMNSDIELHITHCASCNSNKPHQQKEPLQLHTVPDRAWQIVATDLFELDGKTYLLLIDSFSGWIEIDQLHSTTSAAVIIKLKHHFARFGVPTEVMSDNGPQYASRDFRTFATTWGFTHTTSSPEYPQSNGLAERGVQTAKRMMTKAKHDGSDAYLALLALRNTPRDSNLGSPAQRLLCRRTQTTLPVAENLLQPRAPNGRTIQRHLQQKREQQKNSYDRSAAPPRPDLRPGDTVRVQTPSGYKKLGVVKAKLNQPRSYLVTVDGKDLRRNRRHLLLVNENALPHEDNDLLEAPIHLPQPAELPFPAQQPVPEHDPAERRYPQRDRRRPQYLNEYE